MNITSQTMKELPESERPYEKCMAHGPSVLSDAELLAVILRSGTRGRSARDLASEMLHRFGRGRGLGFLMDIKRPELEALPGIGSVKATELMAVGELSRRISRSGLAPQPQLASPGRIAEYFMEEMSYLSREQLTVAMFDTKSRLIRYEVVSVGTVDRSLASPREIFLEALRCQAVYIVILHNHPSGDPTPSREDLRLTEQLSEAGRLLQIPVMDHIIIGDHRFVSLRQEGCLKDF